MIPYFLSIEIGIDSVTCTDDDIIEADSCNLFVQSSGFYWFAVLDSLSGCDTTGTRTWNTAVTIFANKSIQWGHPSGIYPINYIMQEIYANTGKEFYGWCLAPYWRFGFYVTQAGGADSIEVMPRYFLSGTVVK